MTTHWITRIVPDLRHHQARRDLASAVAMHRRIMQLFPQIAGEQPRREFGILFRTDDGPTGPYILMQSRVRPDLAKLPTGYGNAATKSLSPLLNTLRTGMTVHYRITANPVRKPGKTAREFYNVKSVVPLTGAAAEQWWLQHAEQSGLKVATVQSAPLDAAQGKRNQPGQNEQRITHARTRFDGTALIQDADLLRRSVTEGIGRGKAYGCGLLSLAPTRRPQ